METGSTDIARGFLRLDFIKAAPRGLHFIYIFKKRVNSNFSFVLKDLKVKNKFYIYIYIERASLRN